MGFLVPFGDAYAVLCAGAVRPRPLRGIRLEYEAVPQGADPKTSLRSLPAMLTGAPPHQRKAGLRSVAFTPSARSLRCSAERSMPTNSAVREILPPNRLT